MAYEIDDTGVRVIGYNVPIQFYSPARVLKAEIFLQSNDTLNFGGLSGTGGGGVNESVAVHGVGDLAIHTGTLNDAQTTGLLKADGSRNLTGNLTVSAGVTIDGVDIGAAILNPGVLNLATYTLTVPATGTAAVGAGTLTVATANSTASAAHTHAITAVDDAAAAAALLKCSAAGGLSLIEFATDYVASDLIPKTTDTYDIGSSTKLWRKGYLSELETVLFALNTVTISGARQVWGHNAGTLGAAVAADATSADFGQAMTVGDFVEIRGLGAVEYFRVGANVSGTVYKIGADGSGARNLDGSGANAWPAGTPYLVLGASGDGRVEINADGPKLQMLAQGATYAANTEYVRLGNMRSAFGIGANDYWGFGVGDYAGGNYLKYDSNGGFVLKAAAGTVIIDASGVSIPVVNESYTAASALKFLSSGTLHSALYPLGDGSFNLVANEGANAATSIANVIARTTNGNYLSYVRANGTGSSGQAYVQLFARDVGGSNTTTMYSDHTEISGSIQVSGTAYIGDTANAKVTLGLTINQGGADDVALALKSSDVAHEITAYTETDTYGELLKIAADDGGVRLRGYTEATAAVNLVGCGVSDNTTKGTTAVGYINVTAAKRSGTTLNTVGSNANLMTITDFGTTRFIFDAEGSAHADVEWVTFDDYDDVVLLTDLERAMLAQRDPLKAAFVDFLQYNHAALESAGVVHFDRDNPGHAMVNTTKLSMALVGAVRQMGARLDALEQRALTG